jgi:hypothetical protein
MLSSRSSFPSACPEKSDQPGRRGGAARWLALALWMTLGGSLAAAPVIPDANVQSLGGGSYRYTYDLSGVSLMVNQELFIVFDQLLFSSLSNGVTPGGGVFDLLLLQPNNPVGADGGYSLVALTDGPPMAGPFSVDAVYVGSGAPPAGVVFEINQLDANGGFSSSIVPRSTGVPEPGTFLMLLSGSMAVLALQRAAQRSRR